MTFSDKAIKYFCNLTTPKSPSKEVKIINPYESFEVKNAIKKFYSEYFNDNNDRLYVLGINPGRFGGGLTGISFTDPVALKNSCGVENNLGNRQELSSKFIYEMISGYGGVKKFFSKIFLSALYPFALIKNEKNFNYYDERKFAERLMPDIINSLRAQVGFGARRDKVIILGKKNSDYFSILNQQHKFFDKIITLEHPRFIMQYRLKRIDHYIEKYLTALND